MRTITFEICEDEIERLQKLRRSGYKFCQIMLMDGRGRERYVDIKPTPVQESEVVNG